MKTNIRTILSLVTIGAAVSLSQPVFAAEHHKLTDESFAKKAAAGGLTEVELGKLAQQNGDSQDVKDFGAKMVEDHTKINDNLKAIATKDNLTIPSQPNEQQQALIDRLSKESGKQFDDAYVRTMVRAHVMDKALFTAESNGARNPDLKQFANDSLQVITEHLTMIQGIADTHGIATAHHGGGQPMSMTNQNTSSAPVASGPGDAGQSKSGVAPGANGNPAPPAAGNNNDGTSTGNPSGVPNTGDAGQSKSGLAPGANGNPAPQPQQ